MILDLLKAGPVFKERLTAYIRPQVIKGVSSLVNELRSLYNDSGKAKILGEILGSMCDSMEKEMVLSPEDEEEQDPTVQMWLYCFLSDVDSRSNTATLRVWQSPLGLKKQWKKRDLNLQEITIGL